jgi:shikimate kinase
MAVRAVFLVGFMGSGKNTVGRELARRLGWDFLDLDAHIETRERQAIPSIFRIQGEPGFREAENAALCHLLATSIHRDSIVALGGGTFVDQNNRALLREWPTVFLDAPIDDLWERSQQEGVERPLRGDRDQFSLLHAQRLPFYRQAKLTVKTHGKSPAAISLEIESTLHLTSASADDRPRASEQTAQSHTQGPSSMKS